MLFRCTFSQNRAFTFFSKQGRLLVASAFAGIMSSRIQRRQDFSPNLAAFREKLKESKHVVVLTGAGVSAESGIPTFRGAGGFWRQYQAEDLATPIAFARDPSLVWEFYHYRRELARTKEPNKAHIAIAELEKRLSEENKRVVVVTQNIDELHFRAGSKNVIEIHGTLFKTRCTKCQEVAVNRDSPICEALRGRGAPDVNAISTRIPEDQLPRCAKPECKGLLRPFVVWFGEVPDMLQNVSHELDSCDMCLVVGTSAVVYPANMFVPQVVARNIPVAEFNIESTPNTVISQYFFEGPCGTTLPQALAP